MKIEAIEVINLAHQAPPGGAFAYGGGTLTGRLASIVRVTCDDGLMGIGSAYSHPQLVRTVIEQHLEPFLLGRDPRSIDALWTTMYRLTRWYGRKGAAVSAIGALDTAFWDLRGKSLGKPVHELLGASRTNISAYASALFWHDDLDLLAHEASSYVAAGYRRMKMRLGRNEEYDAAAVEAVRRAVGPSIDIMVDGSMRYPLDAAVRIGDVLSRAGVFWFEEPFEPDDIDAYCALRTLTKVAVAAGENEFGLSGFRELMRAGAIDIAQPDVCRAGGISEVYRIGLLAAEHGIRVATHTWSDAVALVANMHVVAALPTGITVEVSQDDNPFIHELVNEPLEIRDGQLLVSGAPGLGITLNEATVRKFQLGPMDDVPEGNYSDMIFGSGFASAAPRYGAS